MNRRQFLVGTGAAAAATIAAPLFRRPSHEHGHDHSLLHAQATQSGASNVEMTSDSYKPVRRPAKPDATPQLDDKQIETLERTMACPCPCTLDVYTCRTTDFSCSISPAVHRDVQALVAGGYSADEIMEAMTDTYGDFILMTPRKRGFNLLAWFAPFVAVGMGAVGIGVLLRRWRLNSEAAQQHMESAAHTSPTMDANGIDASPDELARLEAVLRDDSRA